MFGEEELQQIISGSAGNDMDVEDLQRHTQYSNCGPRDRFSVDFFKAVSAMRPEQRVALLRFATSCSRTPLLGFSHLVRLVFGVAGGLGRRAPMAWPSVADARKHLRWRERPRSHLCAPSISFHVTISASCSSIVVARGQTVSNKTLSERAVESRIMPPKVHRSRPDVGHIVPTWTRIGLREVVRGRGVRPEGRQIPTIIDTE